MNIDTAIKELLDDKNFQNIEKLFESKELNIFKILKLEGNEIRHSNFLGWLLNPRENHGIGDTLIKGLLREAGLEKVDSLDCSDVIIEREKFYIDLLAFSPKEKWFIIIENKTWTKDHDNQLNRYSDDASHYLPGYKPFYIYLTPTGEEPIEDTRDEWKCVGYKTIKETLKNALQEREVDVKAKMFIEDYIKLLEGDLLMENEKEIRDRCIDVYNKHKEAIDLINKYVGDIGAIHSKLYYDALEKNKDKLGIEMAVSTNKYTRFLPNEFINVVDKVGNGWGGGNKYLLLFEVQSDKDTQELRLQIVVGPSSDNGKKKELLEKLLKTKEFNENKAMKRLAVKRNFDINYIWVYEKQIVNKTAYEELSNEKLVEELINYVAGDNFKRVKNKLLEVCKEVL